MVSSLDPRSTGPGRQRFRTRRSRSRRSRSTWIRACRGLRESPARFSSLAAGSVRSVRAHHELVAVRRTADRLIVHSPHTRDASDLVRWRSQRAHDTREARVAAPRHRADARARSIRPGCRRRRRSSARPPAAARISSSASRPGSPTSARSRRGGSCSRGRCCAMRRARSTRTTPTRCSRLRCAA